MTKNTVIIILALLVFAFLSGCGASTIYEIEADRVVVKGGHGGHLDTVKKEYDKMRETGLPVVIDGTVHSADSYYALALPDVCYTPNAVISLHAVSYLGAVRSAKWTERLTNRLPQPIQVWFRNSPAYYDPIGWEALDYDELMRVWPEGRCDVP